MSMPAAFEDVFSQLKGVFRESAGRLSLKTDTPTEYTLVTKKPSPFRQHKGHPMFFGSVKLGKAYVSFHLMPLYMNPTLTKSIDPQLKKRMQGKSCFNFKIRPEPDQLAELKRLTEAGLRQWSENEWI